MRNLIWCAALVAGLFAQGCAWFKKSEPAFQSVSVKAAPSANAATPVVSATDSAAVVTLADGLNGKVSTANNDLKFVVLTFPVGQMARPNQRLNIYRAGLKVGEVIATAAPEMRREDSIVADITVGEAKVGDEVRDK
ncbi:MAG: hypothetical protein H7Y43_13495 [Akkermansiaceae bacterium]|nr:hypothetical protein [Verrucomicrobiales bacterium]